MAGRLRQALARLAPAAWRPPAAQHAAPPGTKASAAAALIAFDSLHQPVWSPRDYSAFAREGFMQNAVAYRCVRMIGEAAASVPLLLYDGDHEIDDHPLLSLVRHPNVTQCTPDLLESWYGFLLVSGNAYLEVVAIDDQPRELHVLRSDRVKVVPGPDGWPEAYEYSVAGRSVRLAGEAVAGVRPVLHLKLFHPVNDHYGLSPIEAAATAIDIHNAASRWNKALLDNSARPSGALVYTQRDSQLSSEQYERLKRELELGFQGAANAGRPLLLEGGLDWKSMSLSPKDMDFIDAKHAAAREIALALGVPPMLLGIPGDNTYGADWSEYFGHQPVDGSGDIHFHLDPLWSSPSIDAVGIDVYWPLADWRDGRSHLDWLAGTRSIHDIDYLKGNLFAGEGFDWYYASAADRDAQTRTPITDGAGKPWVFRYKDIRSWWLNEHFDRPGGVENALPTAWVPQSKPFWFLEIGCPAVDKGANQPNLFSDPKSAESSLPMYSRGHRDDLMQRRLLQAFHDSFDPAGPGYLPGANPTSEVYGAPMVDVDRMHVYAWDARPFPSFPARLDVWGDAGNWRLGHWLNGRMSVATLAGVVARILDDSGFDRYDVTRLAGTVSGYALDRIMSARDALEPLELAFFVDAVESEGVIVFRHRGGEPHVVSLTPDDLVEIRSGASLATLTRAQETELPHRAKISHVSADGAYRSAVAEAARRTGGASRVAEARLPIVLESDQAMQIAETWLFEAWSSRERAEFALPPRRLAIEPSDCLELQLDGGARLYRVTELAEHTSREIGALAIDPEIYGAPPAAPRPSGTADGPSGGQPLAVFLNLPVVTGDDSGTSGYVAALRNPWPGGVAFYRSPEEAGFVLRGVAGSPATIGVTLEPLDVGPEGRIDRAARLRVHLDSGMLQSVSELAMLGGANAAAIEGAGGRWEIVQFQLAELVATDTYELSRLLRGQVGSELAMATPLAAGARFVLLDDAIARIPMSADDVGLPFQWRYGPVTDGVASPSFAQQEFSFHGIGRLPLSPVHIRGTRSGGDLTLSWVRRTRLSGDNWDALDVPLAEEVERYEVDVLSGSTVVRTLTATAPAVSYSAAQQTSDFGSPQTSIAVRVYQISATAGRGSPRPAIV